CAVGGAERATRGRAADAGAANAGLTRQRFAADSGSRVIGLVKGCVMSLATVDLPADPDALRAFALACQAELKAAELSVQLRTLEIEKLKFQIAKLRRLQFGRSSERISRQMEQLELQLEELETGEAEAIAAAVADDRPEPVRARPKRKPLPVHLPRQEIVHQPEANGACICPDCGAGMAELGEGV